MPCKAILAFFQSTHAAKGTQPAMNNRPARYFLISMALALTATVGATEEIATERSELMKSVREATKPVGAMLRGKAEFNAEEIQASLAVYADAASKLGDLVPAGSEGGEAAPAIWEDRWL